MRASLFLLVLYIMLAFVSATSAYYLQHTLDPQPEPNSRESEILENREQRLNELLIQQKKLEAETDGKMKEMAKEEAKLREKMMTERSELEAMLTITEEAERAREELLAREEAILRQFKEENRRGQAEARRLEERLEKQIQQEKEAIIRERQKQRDGEVVRKYIGKEKCDHATWLGFLHPLSNIGCLYVAIQ